MIRKGRVGSSPSLRTTERIIVAIPALVLFGVGCYLLGLLFHAFGRHKLLGVVTLLTAGTLIVWGLTGNTLNLPKGGVTVTHPTPSASHSPSPHHS